MPEAAQHGRCYACGYDLRGNTSGTCPECGRSAPVIIAIHDREEFHYAKAALEQENLIVRAQQPGGVFGAIAIEYGSGTGWLWVDQNDLERAEELLDELGITAHINTHRPIVDRSEPNCPKCNAELDLYGRPQCSKCGTHFDWVEIEAPAIDPTHLLCRECGYELTGLTSDRCPECSSEIADVDRIVAVATHDESERELFHARPRTTPWGWWLFICLVTMVFCGIVAIELSQNEDTSDEAVTLTFMTGVAFCAAMICSVLMIRNRTQHRDNGSSGTSTIH